MTGTTEETTDEPDKCPTCGGNVNHVVRNGYRNTWPAGVTEFWVCTTDESDWMHVHTEELADG